MLLYVEEGAIVINSVHVASVQIVPRINPGRQTIEGAELHFIVSGGKIVHPIPDQISQKLVNYFINPTSMKKLSNALLKAWMEVMQNPNPQIAMKVNDFLERVLELAK